MSDCPKCNQPIHSMDGATSTNGEGFVHHDCEAAARIDYGMAFDQLSAAMDGIARASWLAYTENLTEEEWDALPDSVATALVDISGRSSRALSWANYAKARGVEQSALGMDSERAA